MTLSILAQRMEALAASTPARKAGVARRPPPRLPETPRLLLRREEAAAMLGVSVRTLTKWPVRLFAFGNVRGYRPRDLERFLEKHMVESGDPESVNTWEPV